MDYRINVKRKIEELYELSKTFPKEEYKINNPDNHIYFKKDSQKIVIEEFDTNYKPIMQLEYDNNTQKLRLKLKKSIDKEKTLEKKVNYIYQNLINKNKKFNITEKQKKEISKINKLSLKMPKLALAGIFLTSMISSNLAYVINTNQKKEILYQEQINSQNQILAQINNNIENEISNYKNKINQFENHIENLNLNIPEPQINFSNHPNIQNQFKNLESLVQNIELSSLNNHLQKKYRYYTPSLIDKTNQTFENLFIFWDIIQEQIEQNNNLDFKQAPYFLSAIIQEETNWFNFSAGYSGETGIGQQMPYVVEKNYDLNTNYQTILEQNLRHAFNNTDVWGTRTGFRVLVNTIREIEENNSITINYEVLQEMDPRFNFENQFHILANEISEKINYFNNSSQINLHTIAASYNGGNYGYRNYYPQQYAHEVIGYTQLLLQFENAFKEIINTTTVEQRKSIRNQYIKDNENFINQIIIQQRHRSNPQIFETILNEHKDNLENYISIQNKSQERNISFYERLKESLQKNNLEITTTLNNL